MATNKTITVTLDSTQTKLENRADEAGYRETIKETQDVFNDEGEKVGTERVEVDNPQTKEEYIAEYIKQQLADMLARPEVQKVQQTKRQERREEVEAVKEDAKSRLNVTIE